MLKAQPKIHPLDMVREFSRRRESNRLKAELAQIVLWTQREDGDPPEGCGLTLVPDQFGAVNSQHLSIRVPLRQVQAVLRTVARDHITRLSELGEDTTPYASALAK